MSGGGSNDDHWAELAREIGADVPPEAPVKEPAEEAEANAERANAAPEAPPPEPFEPDAEPPRAPEVVAEESDEPSSFGPIEAADQAAERAVRQERALAQPADESSGDGWSRVAEEVGADVPPLDDPLELPAEPEESFEALAEEMAGEAGGAESGTSLIDVPSEADVQHVTERRRQRRRRSRSSKKNEGPSDSQEGESTGGPEPGQAETAAGSDEEASCGEAPAERPKKHKNIPTWEEAVAHVIEANMQAHRRQDTRRRGGRGRRR